MNTEEIKNLSLSKLIDQDVHVEAADMASNPDESGLIKKDHSAQASVLNISSNTSNILQQMLTTSIVNESDDLDLTVGGCSKADVSSMIKKSLDDLKEFLDEDIQFLKQTYAELNRREKDFQASKEVSKRVHSSAKGSNRALKQKYMELMEKMSSLKIKNGVNSYCIEKAESSLETGKIFRIFLFFRAN